MPDPTMMALINIFINNIRHRFKSPFCKLNNLEDLRLNMPS